VLVVEAVEGLAPVLDGGVCGVAVDVDEGELGEIGFVELPRHPGVFGGWGAGRHAGAAAGAAEVEDAVVADGAGGGAVGAGHADSLKPRHCLAWASAARYRRGDTLRRR
jgi:hypothetical protein